MWPAAQVGCVPRTTLLFCSLYLLLECLNTHAFQPRRPKMLSSRVIPMRPLGHSALEDSAASLRDRLSLYDRFDRWRFLQKLLDEETAANDTNRILFAVLDGYLKFPRPKFRNSEETGSPELTAERLVAVEAVLERASDGAVPVLVDDEGDLSSSDDLLDKLEKLLPDASEDEDAMKGTWDTVIELHGRESVKINEKNATPQWKACCLVARVLLYYDFLLIGLVDSPIA